MLEKAARAVRGAMLRVASNEALFLFFAITAQTFLYSGPLKWYRQCAAAIWSLIVVPWGMVLCFLRLERRTRAGGGLRADVAVLFALLAWLIVPFAYRFGPTENNVTSWYNHTVVFFGLYALVTEEDAAGRERKIDLTAALFAALSFVAALLALYSAWNVRFLGDLTGDIPFGPAENGNLQFGMHYNSSAMLAVCCALLALMGALRRRHLLAKLAHAIPAAMMLLCVVFTQSRTSRYALLLAMAVCLFGFLWTALPQRMTQLSQNSVLRAAAVLLLSLAALAIGYLVFRGITDVYLSRYSRICAEHAAQATIEAQPETEEQDTPEAQSALSETVEQRVPVDSTFSERTAIWGNVLAIWRERPKMLLIGEGVGRIGSLIVQGTSHETDGSVAVHNTYLQFIADYGLIGFMPMLAFLCMALGPCLRVLFAARGAGYPGDRMFVMLALTAFFTGLMESQPLGAMQPMNLALFYALAVLKAHDMETRRKKPEADGKTALKR